SRAPGILRSASRLRMRSLREGAVLFTWHLLPRGWRRPRAGVARPRPEADGEEASSGLVRPEARGRASGRAARPGAAGELSRRARSEEWAARRSCRGCGGLRPSRATLELVVQVSVACELASVEEALTKVADGALDLALGLGAVGPARSWR